ncbi:NADH dehydrogenase [ubiquinone] 1 subunit C2 [Zootoca vivipara]|uniref:NADH dehydrogenase [ubiquinone] 1 subunit C2 n=1 Tax=Zootoca vivipara TaxID=8524 RepID=UPI00159102B3|nr:NADH dehydrogenase [ubiquinone] 1 subunit C2 [Zootoca vivipara]
MSSSSPLYLRLPDEALSLPPPRLLNVGSGYLGFLGWLSVLLDNAINKRPVLRTGVHRQVLATSIFFYIGYYLRKRANYEYALKDRQLSEYVRHHPEDFKRKDKKHMAEVLENFHPIR